MCVVQVVVLSKGEGGEKGCGLGLRIESMTEQRGHQSHTLHHHIAHLDPGGVASSHGLLQEGDEILEVDGRVLVGVSHEEAAGIVGDTPPSSLSCVRVVASRRTRGEEEGGGVVYVEEGVDSVDISLGEFYVFITS